MWEKKQIGDLVSIRNGYAFKSNDFNKEKGVPLVKQSELKGKEVDLSSADYLPKDYLTEYERYVISEGDYLIGMSGSIGKIARYNYDFPALQNQRTGLLEFKSDVNKGFVQYYLKYIERQLQESAKGVAVQNISASQIESTEVLVPPLPTQNRIVEKIEELFSELDNGIENLKKAQKQLNTYRQAVLKDALEGDWDNVKVNDVCERVKVGVVIKPKQYYTEKSEGIPAFRSANVREFRVEDSNWVYFTKEGHDANERTQLNEGDVLLVRSGYPGTSCVVPKKYEGTNAIDILIAEPNNELVLSEYLCVFNNSPLGKGLFLSGSRGVAQKHLNVGVYKNLELPLPPLYEQERIVTQVEASLSIIEKLEQTIKENLQKAEALRQSILKKAFGGELVDS